MRITYRVHGDVDLYAFDKEWSLISEAEAKILAE